MKKRNTREWINIILGVVAAITMLFAFMINHELEPYFLTTWLLMMFLTSQVEK